MTSSCETWLWFKTRRGMCCLTSTATTFRINMNILLYCVPWASYKIRKNACCACAGNAGNAGNVFPARKPQVSDPGMHHGTRVTHVPWYVSRSLTHGGGENVPGIHKGGSGKFIHPIMKLIKYWKIQQNEFAPFQRIRNLWASFSLMIRDIHGSNV